MDFIIKKYYKLLQTLLSQGFLFYTVSEYCREKEIKPPFILLRHDVEAHYENALRFAEMQHKLGIKGTYYFRIYTKPGNEVIISKIADLGHEIGYHYDDLSTCKGGYEKAIKRFEKNLKFLKSIAPVTSATMEGAPFSKYDNRELWRRRDLETERLREEETERLRDGGTKGLGDGETERLREEEKIEHGGTRNTKHRTKNPYDYRDFGIICEPYFDIDFNEVFYLTDTGRRWDGKFAVRDKVGSIIRRRDEGTKRLRDEGTKRRRDEETKGRRDEETEGLRDEGTKRRRDEETEGRSDEGKNHLVTKSLSYSVNKFPTYKTTNNMIKAIQAGTFPSKAMLTFHPQRWHDKPLPWLKELVWQNVKNQVKSIVIERGGKK